jgi:hypothetical protein
VFCVGRIGASLMRGVRRMTNRSAILSDEAKRAAKLLAGKVVSTVRRPTETTVLIEFEDGTRLFVDARPDGLELSVTSK